MSLKTFLILQFAKHTVTGISKWSSEPFESQDFVFNNIIKKAKNTKFGKIHNFDTIKNYDDFKKNVPIRDYEGLKTYFDAVKNGGVDVLWPGKPVYIAKTSGTTSGAKYIPITKESMPYHIQAARNVLFCYTVEKNNASFFDGKMIFLQGNPILEEKNGIKFGRLSGIVAHFIPKYLQNNRLPSWKTNCIDDWEQKIEAIVDETYDQNMTLISGIPPWLIMYFEKLTIKTNKKIGNLFPNFNLLVTGGVNYEPYKAKMADLLGRDIDLIQTFPASEGFIGYQNRQKEANLLLLLKQGIFYEFVPVVEFYQENPTRISIKDVKLAVDYVLIMSTNAGLWAYNIGDTVRFVNLKPYKIIVSGRIKHFTSAFGEHVIAIEVENALKKTIEQHPAQITEFTVAPQVHPQKGLPYHEWLIEFKQEPDDLLLFAKILDQALRELNVYYNDLITGKVLQPLIITKISKDGFNKYMKNEGKLGGQNKVPRLTNDRKIAEAIINL